ncbi:MAG: aldo/keto reductase [Candidatus Zixiibacteriota bacterium]|nr:MAG: aldo/keto reductase [candidate division Zixibacteria bacterium]
MPEEFTYTTFGKIGPRVRRLGLSATYRPGRKTIYKALDAGINCFFGYGFDSHLTCVMRDVLRRDREDYVIITGAYNLIVGHPDISRTLEKRLRQFGTDYIDVFLFLGVTKEKHFPGHLREEFHRLRETGKVRAIGMSCHNRKFAGRLCAEGALDAIMMRYNAAHTGAEQDIFPHLKAHRPGVISYTATRWGRLLRRPRGWPVDGRIPTAGDCYRFVLSNPNVHVCLTAPRNAAQLKENLAALEEGPLDDEDMSFMREFGKVVHHTRKWFM